MRLARVIGQVVSTTGDKRFAAQKLLLVQPVDDRAKPVDRCLLAVDTAQSGIGDYVLVVQEGKSARLAMGVPDAPCEAVIVGVVDYVLSGGEQHALRPPSRKEK